MKKITSLVALSVFLAMTGSYSAMAASSLVKNCQSDLKKFNCAAKNDAEAHECLEKNEQEQQPNEGFSKACYKAHESYEKKIGKGEEHEKS